MIDTFLREWGCRSVVVARVLVKREGTTEAEDLADGFAAARQALADRGKRTSTWGTVVLRATAGDREFEVTFRNVESNRLDDELAPRCSGHRPGEPCIG